MADPSPNQIINCPYNKAHVVEHYRMHIHLQKCRKQYPNCNKAICPIDSTHIVNDVELDYHITVCPKRHLLDSQLYVIDDDQKSIEPAPLPNLSVAQDEDWDNEVTTSYVPDMAKKGNHIIKKVKGATPSERRKVRMEGVKTYRPLQ